MGKQTKSGNMDNYQNKININIKEFNGGDNIDFFIDNLKQLKKLNKWNEEESLLYFKTKLTGPALEFFANSPVCSNVQTLDEACKCIKNFFSSDENSVTNLMAFQSIQFEPGETIKNLANRIDTFAHKAHPNINDVKTLDRIKSFQFLSALPTSLREHLIQEDLDNFKSLVSKTNLIAMNKTTLKSISNRDHCETVNVVNHNNYLYDKINFLENKIQEFENACPMCKQKHTLSECDIFISLCKDNKDSSKSVLNQSVQCHYCGKLGHFMKNCIEYCQSNQRFDSYQNYQSQRKDVQNKRFYRGKTSHPYRNNFLKSNNFENTNSRGNNYNYRRNNKPFYQGNHKSVDNDQSKTSHDQPDHLNYQRD